MCCMLICNLAFNTVMAAVKVEINKQLHKFAHEPHLVEVLAPIANQKKWYWPSAALYQANDTQLEETRQLLLANLSNLINRYQTKAPEIALSLEQLKVTITNWRLARRIPIKIDYDMARIVDSKNPRLPKGDYILELSKRMNTVQLFGAVNKIGDIPHLPHADASEYFTSQTRINLANKDILILIQADGRELTVPIAYWNKNHQEIMPGSQLFVPFNESLFHPEIPHINQQILALALNRLRQ